jgi:ATP-binding cassette, subfamily B, bacterial CvaB/MchF/RaxB
MGFREYAYLQTEPSECGLACLAASAAVLGDQTDLATWRRRFPVARGLSLKQIHEIAAAMHLSVRSVRCDLEEIKDLKAPAILHFGFDHFVVLERVSGAKVIIFDPALGRRTLTLKALSDAFTGVATEITATPQFQRRSQPAPLKLTSLFKWTPQLRGGLFQIALLSILLEIYVLASPYYMQLGVDEAALKGDTDLLVTLAVGFGLFALFNAIATALRAVVQQRVSALLNWEMTVGLFRHLVRLPLPWFQRRRLADVLARFQALDPVKALIANGLISAALDGVLSLATGAMLFFYAPSLAWIVLASLVIFVALRLMGIPVTRNFASGALVASIAEQGKRIETLRSIQTIKVMGAEAEREGDWSNKFADTIRTSQASTFANLAFSTLHDLFGSAAHIAVIGLGAYEVIKGHLTVGMLYAFVAYQSQFLTKASGFFEQIVSWRMLDLYTFRLADIALTAVEPGLDLIPAGAPEITGQVELKGVTFRYSANEKPVLANLSLRIEAGEFVAIIGPSGCGKSSLLKVITGLYPPSHGEVLYDGHPISHLGPKAVRQALGVVMQDDELLAGSIADNVCFFDAHPDQDRIWECLDLACIAEEVRRMPMRTDTFVGDLGSALSGGQRQRVLLARALYRKPRILILDEATSHLNTDLEAAINENLKALSITRIAVAHRETTVAAADRAVDLRACGALR